MLHKIKIIDSDGYYVIVDGVDYPKDFNGAYKVINPGPSTIDIWFNDQGSINDPISLGPGQKYDILPGTWCSGIAADGSQRVDVYNMNAPMSSLEVATISGSGLFTAFSGISVSGTTNTTHYMHLDGFTSAVVQYFITEPGSDNLSLSVHGTLQNDAEPDACLYQNITANGMDILTHTTTSGSYDSDTSLMTQDGSSWKILKLDVTKTGSGDDSSYMIHTLKKQ